MLSLLHYHCLQLIEKNQIWDLYKGVSKSDQKNVIIGIFNFYPKNANTIERLESSFRYIKNSNISGLLTPIDIEKTGKDVLIIFDDMNIVSLSHVKQHEPFSLDDFFTIALKLTEVISKLHQQHMQIGAFSPSHIFVDLNTKDIFFNGIFPSSTFQEDYIYNHPAYYSYMSPELIRGVNGQADRRSDLYSLGIILYELLTKQPPFNNEDRLEMAHSHFTKVPKSPTEINSRIPSMLSKIVLKLLEKNPDRRYQTAFGLLQDLRKCKKLFEQGVTTSFSLGEWDFQKNLDLLFGREKELSRIKAAYEKKGHMRTVIITGASGFGKTALVQKFKSHIGQKSIFISCKFDQYQNKGPFSGLIEAFQTVVQLLMAKGKDEEEEWKNYLLRNLESQAAVLIEILPELEWLLGSDFPSQGFSPFQRYNRLMQGFHAFLMAITNRLPLILFIDDYQWADRASTDLIEYIVKNDDMKNLFLIISCRDNIEYQEKISSLLLKNQTERVSVMKLTPLLKEDIRQWITSWFLIKEDIEDFTSYVLNLTQGNPLFIHQLLISMEKEGIIHFVQELGKHKIQLSRERGLQIKDDLLTLLTMKFQSLSKEVQQILKMAACFGNELNIMHLSSVCHQEIEETSRLLFKAKKEGFLYSDLENRDQSYYFIHDKIRQAIYSNIPDDEKEQLHLKIGFYYESQTSLQEGDRSFLVVEHLNKAVNQLNDAEKLRLAKYNSKAGDKSRNSAAFEAAYQYYRKAKDLLPLSHWDDYYHLSVNIFIGLGESAYLTSRFKEAEIHFDEVLKRAKTNEEKLEIYNLKIILYTHTDRLNEALDVGMEGISLYGWKIRRNIKKWDIAKELLYIKLIKLRFRGKDPRILLDLKKMTKKEDQAILQTLINLNSPAYHVNQNLATFLMLRAFRMTLAKGDTELTALVYNNYSLILSAGFGDFEKSYQFGLLAKEHAEKNGLLSMKARVYFVYSTFINHWKNHLESSLDYLIKSQKICKEVGNLPLAGAASSFIIVLRLIKGDPLPTVLEAIDEQLKFVHKIQFPLSIGFLQELKNWIRLLSDHDQATADFPLATIEANVSEQIMYNTCRLQMYFLINDEKNAKKTIADLDRLVTKSLVLMIAPEFYFYHTLWLCRFYPNASNMEKKQIKKYIRRNLRTIKTWKDYSPQNYEHKYYLMKAEFANILGKYENIEYLYNRSIQMANDHKFVHDYAIACESAGMYSMKIGNHKIAEGYIKEAYNAYSAWGANIKVKDLLKRFPIILRDRPDQENAMKTSEMIDLDALMKASQSLSSEMDFSVLLKKIMNVLVENAGAEKCLFFLKERDSLYLAIEGSKDRGWFLQDKKEWDDHSENYPSSLIYFVSKSKEQIVLDNASNQGFFVDDPYVVKARPVSVLCFPVLTQGSLLGILYMENNVMQGAFSKKKIHILSLLASQAAISIQNSIMYTNLEEKVKLRTKELEMANQHLQTANQLLAEEKQKKLELFSNISHDLRSPISSIKALLDAILDGIVQSSEKQQEYLERCRRRLLDLNQLIEDIVDLSQLETGTISFNKDVVRADKLFTYICEQHEWDVQKSGLRFRVEIPPMEEEHYPLLEVDVRRISQVFTNIISNALKFTTEGEIICRLHIEKDEKIIMEISDTGIGIPEDEIHHIFERTFSNRKNSPIHGQGLGLAICKQIVSYHNGEIWAESEYLHGTKMFISLPVIREDDLL